jgi:hypothetical protein
MRERFGFSTVLYSFSVVRFHVVVDNLKQFERKRMMPFYEIRLLLATLGIYLPGVYKCKILFKIQKLFANR